MHHCNGPIDSLYICSFEHFIWCCMLQIERMKVFIDNNFSVCLVQPYFLRKTACVLWPRMLNTQSFHWVWDPVAWLGHQRSFHKLFSNHQSLQRYLWALWASLYVGVNLWEIEVVVFISELDNTFAFPCWSSEWPCRLGKSSFIGYTHTDDVCPSTLKSFCGL